VHIHFKVRPQDAPAYAFSSQLFFDDTLTDRVHALPPYAAKGQRNMRNDRDGIYRQSGSQTVLQLAPDGDGYAGTFAVGLDRGAGQR
jgi:hypothetical protein